jgi:hypothetical protein
MGPFLPDPDWYKKYWYSQKPAKAPWRVASAFASVAALGLAVWFR